MVKQALFVLEELESVSSFLPHLCSGIEGGLK